VSSFLCLSSYQPVIPLGHRRQMFDAFYGMAHPGAKAASKIMGQRVIWTCMSKDVTQWVKDCQTCSRAKVTRQPAAALQPIPVPKQRFSHIHVDNVGPLPVSREGFRYLFTIIDRQFPWPTSRRRPAVTPSSTSG